MSALFNQSGAFEFPSHDWLFLGIAAALHAVLFAWNPVLLQNRTFAKRPLLVNIEMIDEMSPVAMTGPAQKPDSILETLKQMIMKPSGASPELAAPRALPQATAPVLQESVRPRAFTPKLIPRPSEDRLSSANSQIQVNPNAPVIPQPQAPELQEKRLSGIRAGDIPFQMKQETLSAGHEQIAIPVGNSSAKEAYHQAVSGPALSEKNRSRGLGSVLVERRRMDSLNAGGSAAAIPSAPQSGGLQTQGPIALQERQGGGGMGGTGAPSAGGSIFYSNRGKAYTPAPSIQPQFEFAPSDTPSSARSGGSRAASPFEISGPLRNRAIAKKVMPVYQDWMEEKGIAASVTIFFSVTAAGEVNKRMSVYRSSGYSELDQYVMSVLGQWAFAPLAGGGGDSQSGYITFHFRLN